MADEADKAKQLEEAIDQNRKRHAGVEINLWQAGGSERRIQPPELHFRRQIRDQREKWPSIHPREAPEALRGLPRAKFEAVSETSEIPEFGIADL